MSGMQLPDTKQQPVAGSTIAGECMLLGSRKDRGDLGAAIAAIVLAYSPRDLQQMRWNFS